ncbi:hypothetical protein pb186bvf_013616 [Paramecium bursaria]
MIQQKLKLELFPKLSILKVQFHEFRYLQINFSINFIELNKLIL